MQDLEIHQRQLGKDHMLQGHPILITFILFVTPKDDINFLELDTGNLSSIAT